VVGLDLRYGAESRGAEEAEREEDGEAKEGAIVCRRIDAVRFGRYRDCFITVFDSSASVALVGYALRGVLAMGHGVGNKANKAWRSSSGV
jgi:hypothetical protein